MYGETTGYEGLTVLPQPLVNETSEKYLNDEARLAWDNALELGQNTDIETLKQQSLLQQEQLVL